MFNTEHIFDGNSLLPLWDRLDEWEKEMEAADRWYGSSLDLTDRRFDSARRAGQRLYITASGLIRVAREHQFLLAKTMVGPHAAGVYPHATLNLIRPAFEASLTAFWLLDPDDSRTRVLRGLRQCWEDHRQSDSWAEEMLGSPLATRETREAVFKKKAEVAKRYHEDAGHFRIKWDKVRQKINLVDEIKTLSTVDGDPLTPTSAEGHLATVVGRPARTLLCHPAQWPEDRGGSDPWRFSGGYRHGRRVASHGLPHLSAATQAWAMSAYINRTRALAPRS